MAETKPKWCAKCNACFFPKEQIRLLCDECEDEIEDDTDGGRDWYEGYPVVDD